jgi:hypothetical protein
MSCCCHHNNSMTLFIVDAMVQRTDSPGDDMMKKHPPAKEIRLVEAEDEYAARSKFREAIERYTPYEIRVDVVGSISAHEVIR